MGWTWTHKPKGEPIVDFFKRCGALTWSNCEPWQFTVLDSAVVGMKTFYAAVEKLNLETGERHVWAAVFFLGYAPKDRSHNFGWKDMSEDMGPYEATCPERILNLLTPTDSEYANDWRKRCWARIEERKARPKIVPGDVLRYGGKDYVVEKALGAKGYMVVLNGCPFRMKRTQAARAEVLPR